MTINGLPSWQVAAPCTGDSALHGKEKEKKTQEPLPKAMAGTEDCPLGDDLIEHIFSFLPARDVVKTCVLSRRWRSYWETVSNLRFSGDRVQFVDRVLALYEMEKVQTFHLALRSVYSDHPKIDSWLQFAINHQVEELLLDLKIEFDQISTWRVRWEGHIFSPWFYDCSSLTRLSLRGGRFSLSYCERVCWSNLRSLSIEGVSDEVLRTILLGSPVLDCLTLERPSGVEEIRSTSLRELVIVADAMVSPIDVSTPQLLSLRVRVDEHFEIIRTVEAPSLLDARLDFNGPTETDFCLLKETLSKLQNFTRILLGAWCCEITRPLKVEDVQVSLPNCKSLTLHVPIPGFSFPAIANMLATTPNLEKLVIIVKPHDRNSNIFDLDYCDVDHKSYWHIKKKFKRWDQHLKIVEICGFDDCSGFNYEEVFTLVKFLLGHAFVLETMVIKVMNGSHLEVVGSHKLHEVARQLQRYHRASKHGAVIINYLEVEHGKRRKKGVRVTTKSVGKSGSSESV